MTIILKNADKFSKGILETLARESNAKLTTKHANVQDHTYIEAECNNPVFWYELGRWSLKEIDITLLS